MEYTIKEAPNRALMVRCGIREFDFCIVPEPRFRITETQEILKCAIAYGVVAERLDPHGTHETDTWFDYELRGSDIIITRFGEPIEDLPNVFFAEPDFQGNGAEAREICRVLKEMMIASIDANIVATVAA